MPRYIRELELRHKRRTGLYYALTLELSESGRYGVWIHTWNRGVVKRHRITASKVIEPAVRRYDREKQDLQRYGKVVTR